MAEDRDTLPQMPEPEALGMDFDRGWDGVRAYGYTADQLRAYAAQAVAQEREREFETRADGKVVRKDRWMWGVRRIAAMFFGNRREWEIDDVVEAVRKVAPTEHADDVETMEGFYKQFVGSPSPPPAAPSYAQPQRLEGA